MTKFRFVHLSVLFVVFSLVTNLHSGSKALAAGPCASTTASPGFSIGSQTRGAVVTLCGRYVAEHSLNLQPKKPAPTPKAPMPKAIPPKSKPKPLTPDQLAKLAHRRLAMQGESSFSPTRLVIVASPGSVAPFKSVGVSLGHPRQYRTAYILGRFVALRFTPIDVVLHFDKSAKVSRLNRAQFSASVAYKNRGWHTIRGVVTYRAEYRLNGSKIWKEIVGAPQLAAISARVLVTKDVSNPSKIVSIGHKPLLVANDCLENRNLVGCLN